MDMLHIVIRPSIDRPRIGLAPVLEDVALTAAGPDLAR